MDIKIHAIHFDVSSHLEDHINKKVSKLSKFSDDITSVDVFLKVVKKEAVANKEAEVKVMAPSGDFFASKVSDTFEESVDSSLSAIEKQLIKTKEKARK